MKKTIKGVILALVIIASIPLTANAFRPKPQTADPWFTFTYQPDFSKLPKGITTTKHSEATYSYIALQNTTDIPLYVVNYNKENKTYDNSELSPAYIPHYKLTKQNWFYYDDFDPQFSPLVHHYQAGWFPEQTNILPLSDNDGTYRIYFEKPQNTISDGRPKDVKVPSSQTFNMIFLYNNKEIIIPVEVSYQLNQNYDTNKLSNQLTKKRIQSYIPLFSLIVLLAIAVILKKRKILFTKGMLIGVIFYAVIGGITVLANTNEFFNSYIYSVYIAIAHYPALFILSSGDGNPYLTFIPSLIVNTIVYGLLGAIVYAIYKKIRSNERDTQ